MNKRKGRLQRIKKREDNKHTNGFTKRENET